MTKSILQFGLVQIVALLFFTIAPHAQPTDPQLRVKPQVATIKIKLVNGRNGQPMAASHVNVWVGTERKEAIVIPTDGNGAALLQLTVNTAEINIPNLRTVEGLSLWPTLW
jgi:hypothetical protein